MPSFLSLYMFFTKVNKISINIFSNIFFCPNTSLFSLSGTPITCKLELLRFSFYFFFFFKISAMPHGMWVLSSLTRDQTHISYSGSSESQPLHCQGSPLFLLLQSFTSPCFSEWIITIDIFSSSLTLSHFQFTVELNFSFTYCIF